MAEPTGTVENSSVLIINHPPSSVMRDWSFYTHWTTQCHSKYGWKITPNSLASKWTQSRRGVEFFSCTQVQKRKKSASMDGRMHKWPHKCMLHTHTWTLSFTYTHLPTSPSADEHTNNCKIPQLCANKCIKEKLHLSSDCALSPKRCSVSAPQEVCVKLTAQGPCFKKPPETC